MNAHPPVHRARECAQLLAGLPGVVAVDVLENDALTHAPVVDATVGPDYDYVPPRVLCTLAERDHGIIDVSRRADHFVVVARPSP